MRTVRILCALLLVTSSAAAADWPQWMGPQRDNVWREEGLLQEFPDGGPKIVWRTPIAGGYAGPAVAAGRVFITDYVTAENVQAADFDRAAYSGIERVHCLDAATGQIQWSHQWPVKYTVDYPAGPRCTPTVDENRVYVLGTEGNLFCFDAAGGDVRWSKDLRQAYGTTTALWGYCGHPLVDGEKLLCVAGGEGSLLVALNKHTGAEIWRSLSSPEQGYSPPKIITAGGVRQLILPRVNAFTAVDPETGREYWSVPYTATSGSVIMTPIQWEEYLYLGGYSDQNLLLKLAADRPAAEIVWGNKPQHGVSPINVQPILDGSTIYGVDQSGWLYAFSLPGGERLWQTTAPISERPTNTGTAFLVRQGDSDRYWLFTENGDLIIARLTPQGYQELDRAHVIEPTNDAFGRSVVWCSPAFALGRMFVRNDREIICVELKAQ